MYGKSKVKSPRLSFECTNPLPDMILFANHLYETRPTAAFVQFQNRTYSNLLEEKSRCRRC